jgi:hypothetical protein
MTPDAVVALQFTEPAIAEELAAWCGGEATKRVEDDEPVILVPTAKGPKAAHLQDWIVRRDDGDYYPCTPERFALLHDPLT